MTLSDSTQERTDRLHAGGADPLTATDPEFAALFDSFALGDVPEHGGLDEATRTLAILAALLGCQGMDEFARQVPAALRAGVSAVAIRETVYQAVAYLGMGRVRPFFAAMNSAFAESGVALPLPPQGTVTPQTRREKGTQAQVDIFGEGMRDFWRSGPEETRHVNLWLAANCFGDYYTRGGLDLKRREMITFCFLAALGGCEPQLTAHAKANLRIGNDRAFLVAVVSQCLPWIGYPRSLNALACVKAAAEE